MHKHEHEGPREVYCCHIWKFHEFASHYASTVHLSTPTPWWKRNEQGCCAVLSFTLTLRGDQTMVADKSLHNNAEHSRGFLRRAVKNQPPLTKTHPPEWTSKAMNHLFITVLKSLNNKNKLQNPHYELRRRALPAIARFLNFVVFGVLASMTSPQRSELHSVLRPFNSFAAVQERKKKAFAPSGWDFGGNDFYFFTAVLMKSLNSTFTELPPLVGNKHAKRLTWSKRLTLSESCNLEPLSLFHIHHILHINMLLSEGRLCCVHVLHEHKTHIFLNC